MNEFIEMLKSRRSVRSYLPDPIPEDVLEQILEAGTYAPTGRNSQSPIIIAVTDKAVRDRLSALNAEILGAPGTDPFFGAPVVLVVLSDKSSSTCVYNGSLVMGNLMLAAYSLGVSSCWIHRAKQEFERPEGKEILRSLGIEGDYEGIGHCILGYSDAPHPAPKPRKSHYVYYIR